MSDLRLRSLQPSSYPLAAAAKRVLRSSVIRLGFACGPLRALARSRLRHRAVVLMYHRVLPDAASAATSSNPAILVRRATFELHLQVLRSHFNVLTLEEFEGCLDEGARFPPGACLVTFDDGWVDTYTEAWPLLRQYGVPAVVFLPAAYVGGSCSFWQEQLSHLLREVHRRASNDPQAAAAVRPVLDAFGHGNILDLPPGRAAESLRGLVASLKDGEESERQGLIGRLLELLGTGVPAHPPGDGFMSWDMAREMSRGGIAFGAHGVTHRIMTRLSGAEVRDEVERSREAIERELGTRPRAFCYPNGDWDAAVAAQVKAAGFSLAFSTRRGLVGRERERYALPRVNAQEDMTSTAATFRARAAGMI